ncbi:hypothetical protein [Lysinibacillus sp. NPDC047702]|uniref:hypothetical protein n=1 Tax=unclassified Lysinibacillus TaxID=2636778 RepID=UPI003D019681
MKMLISVRHFGFMLRQEPVKVEKVIKYKGFYLALHRGLGIYKYDNAIWIVSDLLTGARLSVSISEKLALKFAEKQINQYGVEGYKNRQSIALDRVIESAI